MVFEWEASIGEQAEDNAIATFSTHLSYSEKDKYSWNRAKGHQLAHYT